MGLNIPTTYLVYLVSRFIMMRVLNNHLSQVSTLVRPHKVNLCFLRLYYSANEAMIIMVIENTPPISSISGSV